MCGISGIYSLNGLPVQAKEITAQTETLVHRGPDEGGLFISPGDHCGLGIRRLSIIDVAGGQQPLYNEDETIHMVYNGETYNHLDLRRDLKALNHRFRTGSDGEVILHGYEAWGVEGMLNRLRGMGAFALWDEERRQLLLGRDRFGIKPLYYAQHAGRLYFASEIRAILAHPGFPRRVNLTALEAMLTIGFTPGSETMFEGIYRLPPAHYLIATKGAIEVKAYWRLTYSRANYHLSIDDAAAQFLSLLREAVHLRLMSEAPLGALLSGGLDSGAIVTLAQAGLAQKLTTVSISFATRDYDESLQAGELAHFADTDHHRIHFDDDGFGNYLDVIAHLEEPQCWATAAPISQLYRACRQAGLTVVLAGEGADELLGGYHWHRGDRLVRPLLRLPQPVREAIAARSGRMSSAARHVLRYGVLAAATRYRRWLEVADLSQRQQLLSAQVVDALGAEGVAANPLLSNWADCLAGAQTSNDLDHMLYLQTQTRLVNYVNWEVDRMSMAHSIEARVPFLDHKLWEFCASLPPHYKVSRFNTEKYLLRRATRHLLPEATRLRQKKGLASPYARWLRSEHLPQWAEDALSARTTQRIGLFEPAAVQALRLRHQETNPSSTCGPLLMAVLNTHLWYEYFRLG
jgi:asparagine synthase (glutamine-hydrolysing)